MKFYDFFYFHRQNTSQPDIWLLNIRKSLLSGDRALLLLVIQLKWGQCVTVSLRTTDNRLRAYQYVLTEETQIKRMQMWFTRR